MRDAILEDVELARRVKGAGGRLVFLPGAAWAETRMYQNFAAMWRGWKKNAYLLYERRLGRMLKTVAELWLLDFGPSLAFLALCVLFALGWGGIWSILAAVGCFLTALWRQWDYGQALARLGFEPGLADYQIPGAALLGLILLASARAHRSRGSILWKGRAYSTKAPARETQ